MSLMKDYFGRFGNGQSINICKDKWIPFNHSGKITSNLPLNNNERVADLLLSSTSWDMNKLKNIFLPFEVEAIIRIPLLGNNISDSRFQKPKKLGRYSIKSGYWNHFTKISNMNIGEAKGSFSSTNTFWNKIWSSNIPPKVKIFIWKATQDIIAMEYNLANHQVPCEPRCILCGYFKADSTHALFFCHAIK